MDPFTILAVGGVALLIGKVFHSASKKNSYYDNLSPKTTYSSGSNPTYKQGPGSANMGGGHGGHGCCGHGGHGCGH